MCLHTRECWDAPRGFPGEGRLTLTFVLSVSGLKTSCPVLVPSRLCHSLYHTSVFLEETNIIKMFYSFTLYNFKK